MCLCVCMCVCVCVCDSVRVCTCVLVGVMCNYRRPAVSTWIPRKNLAFFFIVYCHWFVCVRKMCMNKTNSNETEAASIFCILFLPGVSFTSNIVDGSFSQIHKLFFIWLFLYITCNCLC